MYIYRYIDVYYIYIYIYIYVNIIYLYIYVCVDGQLPETQLAVRHHGPVRPRLVMLV